MTEFSNYAQEVARTIIKADEQPSFEWMFEKLQDPVSRDCLADCFLIVDAFAATWDMVGMIRWARANNKVEGVRESLVYFKENLADNPSRFERRPEDLAAEEWIEAERV